MAGTTTTNIMDPETAFTDSAWYSVGGIKEGNVYDLILSLDFAFEAEKLISLQGFVSEQLIWKPPLGSVEACVICNGAWNDPWSNARNEFHYVPRKLDDDIGDVSKLLP